MFTKKIYLCRMKNTKERILKVSLELFNTKGLSKIKLRTIANKMGISQGNLNYHFKKREDILEALYFRLIQSLNQRISEIDEADNILKALLVLSETVMLELYEYRFILLDFVQIMRENERIKLHFRALQELRKKQFLLFFDLLINKGLMRKEKLPNEYNNLYKRLQILGDFWMSSAEISQNHVDKEAILKYKEIINQTIFPYLTKKGKKEYLMAINCS